MNRFSSKSLAVLAILITLLMTGQGLASGFVFCVGEDGHSTIEQAFAGKCAPAPPSSPAESECGCAAEAHDHCGACDDYPAPLHSLHARSRGQDEAADRVLPAMAAAPSFATTLFVRDLTAPLSPLPPPHPTIALLALRTVVLLH